MCRLLAVVLFLPLLLPWSIPASAQSNVLMNFRDTTSTTQQVSPANPMPIGGGFVQSARTADLTATTSSSNVAFGVTAPTARVCNSSTTITAYVALGTSSAVTVTAANGIPTPAGTCINLSAVGYSYIAGITGSSSATLQISLGSGIASLGGGGSGGGGGGATSPGGSNTQVQWNNANTFDGITGATTNGTALTLVAPILGTPASATLTNATGLPISTGVSGLGTGVATALGNTAGGASGFALVGTTPPTGAAGGDLTGTYPNPTLAAVVTAGGPTGSATVAPIITYDAKGRLTTVSSATITPAIGSVTGLGTGVATALAVNVGSAGAPVVLNGALGTPSSGTATNLTGLPIAGITGLGTGVGTALAINIGSAGAPVLFNGAGGTPSSLVGTNITGTASGLTAGSVTTNANLTGPITSSGNATSIASQTGTGTKFVVDTNPTLVTPNIGTATGTGLVLTSASATALTVGLNGSTNPAFNVDASTASQVAGLNVRGAATGGTVAISTTDSGSNANLTMNAKGSGTIGIGSVSTGAVTITPATTVSGILTVLAGHGSSFNSFVFGDDGGGGTELDVRSATGTNATIAIVANGSTYQFAGTAGSLLIKAVTAAKDVALAVENGGKTATLQNTTGNFVISSTATATSKTTGSLQTGGGLGVAGATFTDTLNVITMANTATTSAVCYNTGTGLFTYNATVGTCTVSDERYKNIENNIPGALGKLLQINGFYYTWNDQKYGAGHQIGVGAQTVERVFPELVSTGSDGVKSVDYQRLTAPIIEALRELKADNDNLRTEIATLKRARR